MGSRFGAVASRAKDEVAPIREQLVTAGRELASILGNRELFGRLAASALLPELTNACEEWKPDFIIRDPCEYASAVLSMRRSIPTATVAISLGSAERGSLTAAAPALEAHEPGLTDFVRSLPYLTRFPASPDPTVFASTIRYREAPDRDEEPLPDWWSGSQLPLVYVTFGTVFGHMSFAKDVLNATLTCRARPVAPYVSTFAAGKRKSRHIRSRRSKSVS